MIECAAIARAGLFSLAVCCLVQSLPAQEPSAANSQQLTEREKVVHLLSRLSFGPTRELVDGVEKIGMEAWLDSQLKRSGPDDATREFLERFQAFSMSSQRIYRTYVRRDEENRDRRRDLQAEIVASVLYRAVHNQQQVGEVMTDFWRNHFNVDRSKDSVAWTVVDYDRSVLRKHVFGNFHDMLEASAKHPAMLVYLDNHVSRRPPNKTELKTIARRVRQATGSRERGEEAAEIAAQRGLNENYARELLELHTLGVDRGYTQKDVIAVAEILTGWSVERGEDQYVFRFNPEAHVVGDKFLMGKTVRRQKQRHGQREGEELLQRLTKHPNTATFIAEKMCRYLVDDHPPESLIASTAAELRGSDLDLVAAVRHIVTSPEFFERRYYRAKFKTPFEFVVSALRVTRARITDARALAGIIEEMGQGIYICEDPTGYRDTAESWRDPGVMTARWRFALDLVRNRIRGVSVPETLVMDIKEKSLNAKIAFLGREVLPAGMRSETLRYCIDAARRFDRLQKKRAQDAAETGKGKKKKRQQSLEEKFGGIDRFLLGVLIGSPEFQEQ